jgi:hypothetical protein
MRKKKHSKYLYGIGALVRIPSRSKQKMKKDAGCRVLDIQTETP